MKKHLALCCGLVSGVSIAAQPVSQPLGSSFTLGGSTNVRALSTSLSNPAAPFLMVDTEAGDRFRFGLFGPIGGGYEIGPIDDLEDKINEIEDKVDTVEDNPADALTLQDDFNELIAQIGDDATFKFMGATQVPLMPFIYKHPRYGAFTVSADMSFIGSGRVLDDEANIVVNPLTSDFQLNTTTSIYVKNAADLNLAFGYSKDVWTNQWGMLVGGTTLNVHNMILGKSVLSFAALGEDDAEDAFVDELEENQKTTTNASIDFGLIWLANNYQLGVAFNNLNEPEFDYEELAVNCTSLTSETDKANCFSAKAFATAGEIAASETYTMERQITVDAAASLANRQWTVAGSYDLFEVNDPVGDLYQWATVSASYLSESNWIPGVRIGYRKNMAGTELSYATLGATLFKRANFDLAYGLEDADGVPRSLFLSLGVESAF